MNRFARDVGINVLANLIANVIALASVYLLGVWVGLFPNVSQLVTVSSVVLYLAVFALAVTAQFLPGERRRKWRPRMTRAFIVGTVIFYATVNYVDWRDNMPLEPLTWAEYALLGSVFAACGAFLLWMLSVIWRVVRTVQAWEAANAAQAENAAREAENAAQAENAHWQPVPHAYL